MRRLLFASLLTLPLAHASAATIEVNNLGDVADPLPEDGICNVEPLNPVPQCTLRAAIQTANALPGHDTIVLQSGGIYQLNLQGEGGAEVGDLNITESLDILGFIDSPPDSPGDLPLINASGLNNRHFRVHHDIEVLMRGLRMQGGQAGAGSGGAILNEGRLTLDYSEFRFNRGNRGGAIYLASGVVGEAKGGGFPQPLVSLTVRDSHFERNDAILEGGAIRSDSATLLIERSSFRDNRGLALDGSTLRIHGGNAQLLDSTFDGSALAPPIAGIAASIGIQHVTPLNLVMRNVTVTGFSLHALDLANLNANAARRVRVGNSILGGGVAACRASGPDVDGANVLIAHSLVQGDIDCAQHYQQVLQGAAPQLGAMMQDEGRLTWSRPPADLFANVVDAGIEPDTTPSSPELACTATDQRGNPRPQDGNGDEIARCDLGAVEEGEPTTFVVDSSSDAVDDSPGDGLCETLSFECTLRAAVMEANALPGIQRIRFAPEIGEVELILPPHPAAAGGDLDLSEGLIINGNRQDGRPATAILQTVAGERLFDLPAAFDGPVILRHLLLKGGDSGAAFGGAIRQSSGQLTVQNSELSGNYTPLFGGAIAVHAGSVNLEHSDLHSNSAEAGGGALFVGANASASVLSSSFWNHSDTDPFSGAGLAALWVEANGTLRLSNSTVTQNSAAVFADSPNALFISHSTLAENHGIGLQGDFGPANQVSILHTIIANNGQAMLAKGIPPNCLLPNLEIANVLAFDYVLDSDGSCPTVFGTVFSADPMLLPLTQLAGQASRAMPPRFEPSNGLVSPALDVAPSAGCLSVDQAGGARPVDLPDVPNIDGPCDLGAIEIQTDALFGNGFEE